MIDRKVNEFQDLVYKYYHLESVCSVFGSTSSTHSKQFIFISLFVGEHLYIVLSEPKTECTTLSLFKIVIFLHKTLKIFHSLSIILSLRNQAFNQTRVNISKHLQLHRSEKKTKGRTFGLEKTFPIKQSE